MIIYTDGSCLGNGKKLNEGGFGVVVLDNQENLLYNYQERSKNTTNNREELKAILYAMKNHGENILDKNKFFTSIPTVYSDSSYCVNTFNQWMFSWAKKGWKKSNNQTPENLDLIQEYYNLYEQGYRIELKKVKGHAGVKWNEMADALATGKMQAEKEEID